MNGALDIVRAELLVARNDFDPNRAEQLGEGLLWLTGGTVDSALVATDGFGSVELLPGSVTVFDQAGNTEEMKCGIRPSSVFWRGTPSGRALICFAGDLAEDHGNRVFSAACVYRPGSLTLGSGVLQVYVPISHTCAEALKVGVAPAA